MASVIYPFTALVGQDRMKRALLLNAINPQIGGVLIRGERGTAKSTAARALAALLPEIDVVSDCPYNCDPDDRGKMCSDCLLRIEKGETLPIEKRKTRIVDLPVSATEDRVVGTLDIEKAIQKGERHFEPGVLAAANRGILYVDEVNLLDDHVVDLLLDSAAMGVNVVEREGISISHPAEFILVGTMNPEEGDLRPQLLDRFALCVDVTGIHDSGSRVQIIERRMNYEENPGVFRENWLIHETALADRISKARKVVHSVKYTMIDLVTIAELTTDMHVDGHRADLVILKTARANAAFDGRDQIANEDIRIAAELALPHRFRRTPFGEAESSLENLQSQVERARNRAEDQSDTGTPKPESGDVKKNNPLI